MKKPPSTSIVRRVSVTMPMDPETFRELFSSLPSAPNLLRVTKLSVPDHELYTIMPAGWSLNTFKTSTTRRLQPGKPVELDLLERRKVLYDHSRCLHCQGGNGASVACKDVVRRIAYEDSLRSPEEAQRAHKVNLGKTQSRQQVDYSSVTYRWVGPVKKKKTARLGATIILERNDQLIIVCYSVLPPYSFAATL